MNRSDFSRTYKIGQTPLAQLRPEKLDDATIQTQIKIIQNECGNVDPDSIALILHECDNNIQNTIKRIKSGNFQDKSWKKAKSNNKKKNPQTNSTEQFHNGNIPSDNERSTSQITSPTPSIRLRQSKKQNDQFEILNDLTKTLKLENSRKKLTKRSKIPEKPVSMHRTIKINIPPLDIQFGDVQWNNSEPIIVNSIEDESIQSEETTKNSTVLPIDGPSHLSDHLNESTFVPIPTSTPNVSPISENPNLSNSSAFTSYNGPTNFPSIQRDFSQQTTNSKTMNYSQHTSYQIPTQQQVFLGTYPYPTPTFYPLITPVEHWTSSGFDPYGTYSSTNFLPTFATQQQFAPSTTIQSTKFDHQFYEKDFGQNRLTNIEVRNLSQTTKDVEGTSKLSANAASFPQGTSLTTNQATTYYVNPFLYALPTYYTTHQDRTISYPIDTRDNRTGASFSGNLNRNHFYQQQRSNNNSNWNSQQ